MPTCSPCQADSQCRTERLQRVPSMALLLLAGMLAMCGCQSAGQPMAGEAATPSDRSYLLVAEGQYDDAFDAALGVVRQMGFEPALRDRRAGLIEAGPAGSPSILEPWKPTDPASALENTLHMQRRIVRVAFEPAGFVIEMEGQDPLTAPLVDLTGGDMPLRMLVTVVVERQQRPIDHRVSWSLAARSEAWQLDPATGERRQALWQAVRRDPLLEDQMRDAIQRRLSGS